MAVETFGVIVVIVVVVTVLLDPFEVFEAKEVFVEFEATVDVEEDLFFFPPEAVGADVLSCEEDSLVLFRLEAVDDLLEDGIGFPAESSCGSAFTVVLDADCDLTCG